MQTALFIALLAASSTGPSPPPLLTRPVDQPDREQSVDDGDERGVIDPADEAELFLGARPPSVDLPPSSTNGILALDGYVFRGLTGAFVTAALATVSLLIAVIGTTTAFALLFPPSTSYWFGDIGIYIGLVSHFVALVTLLFGPTLIDTAASFVFDDWIAASTTLATSVLLPLALTTSGALVSGIVFGAIGAQLGVLFGLEGALVGAYGGAYLGVAGGGGLGALAGILAGPTLGMMLGHHFSAPQVQAQQAQSPHGQPHASSLLTAPAAFEE